MISTNTIDRRNSMYYNLVQNEQSEHISFYIMFGATTTRLFAEEEELIRVDESDTEMRLEMRYV